MTTRAEAKRARRLSISGFFGRTHAVGADVDTAKQLIDAADAAAQMAQVPISPICRTPLFPTSQKLNPFLGRRSRRAARQGINVANSRIGTGVRRLDGANGDDCGARGRASDGRQLRGEAARAGRSDHLDAHRHRNDPRRVRGAAGGRSDPRERGSDHGRIAVRTFREQSEGGKSQKKERKSEGGKAHTSLTQVSHTRVAHTSLTQVSHSSLTHTSLTHTSLRLFCMVPATHVSFHSSSHSHADSCVSTRPPRWLPSPSPRHSSTLRRRLSLLAPVYHPPPT